MRKTKYLFMIFLIIGLISISTVITPKAVSRPAYALSETDTFIVNNDYELLSEELLTPEPTVTQYYSIWISPSACYPVEEGTPPCTAAFAAGYSQDSEAEQYDDDLYDALRSIYSSNPGWTDITKDVPGAGLAFMWTPVPNAWTAWAYFGVKIGLWVVVGEATVPTEPISEAQTFNTDSYDEAGMKAIIVAIGEKVADVLDIKMGPGFTAIPVFGALICTAAVILAKKKR